MLKRRYRIQLYLKNYAIEEMNKSRRGPVNGNEPLNRNQRGDLLTNILFCTFLFLLVCSLVKYNFFL